jgi:hypothetical protein
MNIDSYNVKWDSPSDNARGSMPLGNGDITLNAWAEKDGSILFYIGKSDSWAENGRLLKVGRIRVRISPNPFESNYDQELKLQHGEVSITISGNDVNAEIKLWVDANYPVIHLTINSDKSLSATASFELWRTERMELPSLENSDIYYDDPEKHSMYVEPDTVWQNAPSGIGFYHHNETSVGPELTMEFQDLVDAPWNDPLLYRTFGALVRADNGRKISDTQIASPEGKNHYFSTYVLTQNSGSVEEWKEAILKTAQQIEGMDCIDRYGQHRAWWGEFWSRSHVYIESQSQASDGKEVDDKAHVVARGYNLQRFITACAGRGAYPIKFNGSTFVMPWPDKPGDADYRRWGPGYWWQNSRLPYLSLCATGDFEFIKPFFAMYGGEVLDVCRYRTEKYMGIDGAFMPECVYPWGAVFMESYGWETKAAEREDKLQESSWHKWEWVAGLELSFMMLDYWEYTQDINFLVQKAIPTALDILRFFDGFYDTGADGKLFMHPSQSCETWWDCDNPMPELAGLHAVTARLLTFCVEHLTALDKEFLADLRDKLPDLPMREVDGVRMLAPAQRFENKQNFENPELYAVFPFRQCSFEKNNAEEGKQALTHRWHKINSGWCQDEIFMAYLGMADDAASALVERANNSDPSCRFPAFWGPNFDWTPDQDHGGILMKAVQAMLLQCDGKDIYLLPAWPKDWDVEFKLHAPYQTVIEGTICDGNITHLKVSPEERMNDITVLDCQ